MNALYVSCLLAGAGMAIVRPVLAQPITCGDSISGDMIDNVICEPSPTGSGYTNCQGTYDSEPWEFVLDAGTFTKLDILAGAEQWVLSNPDDPEDVWYSPKGTDIIPFIPAGTSLLGVRKVVDSASDTLDSLYYEATTQCWGPLAPSHMRNATIVFDNLGDTFWKQGGVPGVFDLPQTAGTRFTLRSSTTEETPTNTFGYFETREFLDPPDAGLYFLIVHLKPFGQLEGRDSPDVRVRLFGENVFSQQISTAATARAIDGENEVIYGLPQQVTVPWYCNGKDRYKVAIDLLSFQSSKSGGFQITRVENTPLPFPVTWPNSAATEVGSSPPSVTLNNLTEDYWTLEGVPDVFAMPVNDANTYSLGFSTTEEDRTNTFGYWETKDFLDALSPGLHRIRVYVQPYGQDGDHDAPDVRVRVFTENTLQQRIATIGSSGEEYPLPRYAELVWDSDSVSQWKIAVDLLSFSEQKQGGIRIQKITAEKIWPAW